MGQRTQIYIAEFNPAHTFPDVPKEWGSAETVPNPNNHGDRVKLSMYHNQWGYGYRMLMDVAGLFLTARNSRITESTQVLGTHLHCENDYINGRGEWQNNKHCEQVDAAKLCRPFSESLNDWKNMVNFGDNNNGICVIYREVDDYGTTQKSEVLFLRGDEDTPDGGEPAKVLTATEYLEQFGEADAAAEALKIWGAICDAYEIKEFSAK